MTAGRVFESVGEMHEWLANAGSLADAQCILRDGAKTFPGHGPGTCDDCREVVEYWQSDPTDLDEAARAAEREPYLAGHDDHGRWDD